MAIASRSASVAFPQFATEISGRLVVLDLERDRYLLGEDRPAGAALGGARGGPLVFDAAAENWAAIGALWPEGPIAAPAAVRALTSLHRVGRLLDRHPFRDLVAAIKATPTRRGRAAVAPQCVLASFEAARPLYPRARVCRLDAPAICLLLRRYGQAARLVFGARLEPFGAHCWAELDGQVLNEPVEAVRPFRPLLVV